MSYDEISCGTWVNGLKLYKKTIDTGKLPNTNTQRFKHNISNITGIVKIEGVAISDDYSISLTLPYVSVPGTQIQLNVTKTEIVIITQSDRSNYRGYVTVYYTKTIV